MSWELRLFVAPTSLRFERRRASSACSSVKSNARIVKEWLLSVCGSRRQHSFKSFAIQLLVLNGFPTPVADIVVRRRHEIVGALIGVALLLLPIGGRIVTMTVNEMYSPDWHSTNDWDGLRMILCVYARPRREWHSLGCYVHMELEEFS